MESRLIVPMLIFLIASTGCQREQAEQGQSHAGHSHSHVSSVPEDFALPEDVDASKYVLSAEPEGAQDVIAARQSAQNDNDVVIRGRIGGGESPWVGGRAAFSIVDPSLKACNDIPGDNCPAPWDYCCETEKLPASSALITVIDENGDVVKADARALLGVKELSTVVVKGKAKVDDAGNLVVLANGVFVKSL